MKTALKLIGWAWLLMLAACILLSAWGVIVQQHRLKLYKEPYLRLGRTVLSGPGEIVVPFRVPFVTEARSIKVFPIPELPFESLREVTIVVEDAAGKTVSKTLLGAACGWEGKNYSCAYFYDIVPGDYRLRVRTGTPAERTVIESLIVAPSSEFGGLILQLEWAVFLVSSGLLAISAGVYACFRFRPRVAPSEP